MILSPHLLPVIDPSTEQNVTSWRLPYEVSQSKLCGRMIPSNACALIVLKIAEVLHRNGIEMPIVNNKERRDFKFPRIRTRASAGDDSKSLRCPSHLIHSLLEGIILGNEEHEVALKKREESGVDKTPGYQNFTIPDALVETGQNFREVDFINVRGTIDKYFHRLIKQIISSSMLKLENRLYMVMIACERAVLLVYDRFSDSITLFDTHTHFVFTPECIMPSTQGSIIATSLYSNIRQFSKWVLQHIFPEECKEFELSLVTFCGDVHPDDCASGYHWPLPKLKIFDSDELEERRPLKKSRESAAVSSEPVQKRPLLSLVVCNNEEGKENVIPLVRHLDRV